MSGDEVFVFAGSALLAVVMWGAWYIGPRRIRRLGRPASGRLLLDLAPLVSLGVLLVVLKTVSAHDVRDDLRYLLLYFSLGAMWVSVAVRCLPLVGLSARDDVGERGNGSAAHAVAGALLALTLCFAGGNIGDGPGWWVVVFCAGMATVTLLLTGAIVQKLGERWELISVERDAASGVRLAGFLVAVGLVCGRGAAGDWTSAANAVRDFVTIAWPVLPLAVVEIVASRLLRPTPERPEPPPAAFGFIPAAVDV